MPNPITNDKVVHSFQVLETRNYSKFKVLEANRSRDPQHAKRLAKKIEREGNLTQYFPVIVNEHMEVIDGQNRLVALEMLEYPVFYSIIKGLNIDSVISLNTGHKNWTWRDFAQSHAERGNTNYQQFLELSKATGENRFGILHTYAKLGVEGSDVKGGKDANKTRREEFQTGDFTMRDYDQALKLLSRYYELVEVSNINVTEFAAAAIRVMRTPGYNHEVMVDRILGHGDNLNHCYTTEAFYDELKNLQAM